MGVFGLREIGQPQSHAQIDPHRRERISSTGGSWSRICAK
jgi:hypothetical protein